MRERRRFRRIDIDLDGLIAFHRTSDTAVCAIRDINRECMGVKLITPDPHVCARENIDLTIFIPSRSDDLLSAKCTGRITWYSEDEQPFESASIYKAGVFITDVSKIDEAKLVSAIDFNRTWR
jgi:hypothetical protein